MHLHAWHTASSGSVYRTTPKTTGFHFLEKNLVYYGSTAITNMFTFSVRGASLYVIS